MKEVKKNRTQRRVSRTRRKLQKAALLSFTEKGVDATTIEDITERADLGKGTFYRHFSGKDELLQTLVDEAVDRLVRRIGEHDERFETLEEALEYMLAEHVNFFTNHREDFILLFQSRLLLKLERDDASPLEEPLTRYLSQIEEELKPFLAQAVSPAKIRRLAYAVAGFVSGFLSFAMIGMEQKEIEKNMESLRRALVSGLMAFLEHE